MKRGPHGTVLATRGHLVQYRMYQTKEQIVRWRWTLADDPRVNKDGFATRREAVESAKEYFQAQH